MKLDKPRPGVFTITLATHELSALLAGARMSLSLMQTDPRGTTREAQLALESVLSDFDAALARAGEPPRG
jgi:hypothetical protein